MIRCSECHDDHERTHDKLELSDLANRLDLVDGDGAELASASTVEDLIIGVRGEHADKLRARAVELVKSRLDEPAEIEWTLSDGNETTFRAFSDFVESEAEEVATSWVTPSELESTLKIEAEWWPTVLGRELASRHDLVFSGEWTFEPDEPECSGDEGHDWDSEDGAFASGHGSQGVVEVCRRCGIRKTWDGGASDAHGEQVEVTSYARPE